MENGFTILEAEQARDWLHEVCVPPEEWPLLKDWSSLGERVSRAIRVGLSNAPRTMTEFLQGTSASCWYHVQRNTNLLRFHYSAKTENPVFDIPQDIDYWCELRETGPFDMWPLELKIQSERLLQQ